MFEFKLFKAAFMKNWEQLKIDLSSEKQDAV